MSTELSTQLTNEAIIFNPQMMQQLTALAEVMATSKVTVPKHFQGSTGDCLAVVMQAAQWGMSPFVVSQKTHVINGILGYEAQLVNAVIQQSGAIVGRFHYEYKGDGDNLECRVGAVIRGEHEITWGEWLRNGSVTIKNSPLWKTNPKQQLGYLQVKNWSRQYCPGAILGVYTTDEIETSGEKIINPVSESEAKTDLVLSKLNKPKPEIEQYIILETVLDKINAINSKESQAATKSLIRQLSPADEIVAKDIYQQKIDSFKKTKKEPDWKQLIYNCETKDQLTEIIKTMPDQVKIDFNDDIDGKLFDFEMIE